MGETFLDRHGIKSGIKLNDVIEDFKYVYKGQEVKAGDLVNYINGIASKEDYGESVDTQLSTEARTGYTISAVQLDENRVFIAHSYGTSYYLYGVVCTISGGAITYGADTQLSTITTSGAVISCVLLPNGNVFIAHSYTSYPLYGMVCSINGTTITTGTDTGISTGTSSTLNQAGFKFSACLLSNGNVFIAHSAGDNRYLYGIVCKINGTTITTGTDTQLSTTKYTGFATSLCLLPNGNIFIAHSYGSDYYLYGMVCSIDGTTITKGSDTAIVNTSSSYAGQQIATCLLADGNVFIAHRHTNTMYLYGIVCSINGTTITVGTDTAINSSVPHTDYGVSPVLLPNGNVFISHAQYIDTKHHLYGIICSVEGTKITVGEDTPLNVSDNSTAWLTKSLLMPNGTIFTAHSNTENNYYLYAQIFGIDYENNIPTNNIVITEYEQQVTPAIEPPFNAVALSSGVGAPEYVEVVTTKTGNIFPTTWTEEEYARKYSSNGYTLEAIDWNTGSWPAKNICDGQDNTYWESSTKSSSYDYWVKMTLPSTIKITKMKIHASVNTGTYFGGIIVQGSNDDDVWEDIYDVGYNIPSVAEFEINSKDFYKYYRLYIKTIGSGNRTARVWVFETSEYIVKEQIPSTEHNEQVKIARVYKILTKTDDILAQLYKEGKATVKASSQSSSSDGISSMFDGDETTGHCAASASSSYAKVEFEEAQKILKMKLKFLMGGETANFTSMTVQGSNNNSEWTDLCVINEQLDKLTEVTLENTDYYKYYQLYCTKPGNSSTWIYEWQVSEYETEVVG